MVKINDIYEVNIIKYDNDGKGITYLDDKIVFVDKALKDEIVKIRIDKINYHTIFATAIEIIKPSPNRIELDCKIANLCGGCQLRYMTYDEEAKIKQAKVEDVINKIAKLDIKVSDIIKANNIKHYRNKVIIPFQKENEIIKAGMYKAKSHEIIDNNECLLEPEELKIILDITKEYLGINNISIYDENTKTGIFRGLMLRKNTNKELMIAFIVREEINLNELIFKLKTKVNLKTSYLNINKLDNNVMLTNNNILIDGKTFKETILNKTYNVSPNTFLQVNHEQTEILYKTGLELLDLSKDDILIDAYCGMGSISLIASDYVKEVHGIEIVEQAIVDALENAKENGVTNAFFYAGKCEDLIENLTNKIKVTSLIVDPPRKGCDQKFIDTLIKAKIKKVLYISCNASTLARDLNLLKGTYNVEKIIPVDLFPRTNHVETIASLLLNETCLHLN